MANVVFYILCLLYALSTATFVGDLLNLILGVSYNFLCEHIIFIINCAAAHQYTIASTSN